MRNNLYVNITGTLDGEGKAVEFKGAEGVVCYASVPVEQGTECSTLVLGRLGDRDIMALLDSIRRAVGPWKYVRILAGSLVRWRLRFKESKEV